MKLNILEDNLVHRYAKVNISTSGNDVFYLLYTSLSFSFACFLVHEQDVIFFT